MSTKFKNTTNSILLSAILLLFTTCKKEKDKIDNEKITTLQLELTAPGTSLRYIYDDPDGPGGAPPTSDVLVLKPGTAYNMTIRLWGKPQTLFSSYAPVWDNEIFERERDMHRFYFTATTGNNIEFKDPQTDQRNVPFSNGSFSTVNAATGKLTITLRHYQNKNKEAGDLVNDPKANTDIEATFDVVIQ